MLVCVCVCVCVCVRGTKQRLFVVHCFISVVKFCETDTAMQRINTSFLLFAFLGMYFLQLRGYRDVS